MNKQFLDRFKAGILIVATIFIIIVAFRNAGKKITSETIKIISSAENEDLNEIILDYNQKNNVNIEIEYAGTIDIIERLNSGEEYDALWLSNSMWKDMLNENIKVSDSKVISTSPVIFGVRKEKAEELGIIKGNVKLQEIIDCIKENKVKFAMASATQTNTGACAYLEFLSALSKDKNESIEESLNDENIKSELSAILSGVDRSSGDEKFLEEMYLEKDCDAIITYESQIININKKIENEDDFLYAIYTDDGTSISDSLLMFLGENNTKKETEYLKFQDYLLSDEIQQELMKTGRRVVNENVTENIDNDYGIDITKQIEKISFPQPEIIQKALNMYQSELRKPTHILFALDYSGSMSTNGADELKKAMNYILDVDKASKNFLQFSVKDKISIIFFNDEISDITTIEDGTKTSNIIEMINNNEPSGGTNIYDSLSKAIAYLDNVDNTKYNTSVVLMTDGEGTEGDKNAMIKIINGAKNKIPVYSIMFGDANNEQLTEIADLTSGKVFDGRSNLLEAFKTVRGYN